MDEIVEENGTVYCDLCGEFPIYISRYKDNEFDEEEFICKKCYEES